MQNPFDIQSALLARHAQHVVLVHFPIGLFITGVVFDLLRRYGPSDRLWPMQPITTCWWRLLRRYLSSSLEFWRGSFNSKAKH